MRIGRHVLALAAAAILSGCTNADWEHTMSYVGLGDAPAPVEDAPAADQAVATPATPPTAPSATRSTTPATAETAPTPVAAPPQPVETPQWTNAWCARTAKAAQDDAAEQGFDVGTQKRRAKAAYEQCALSPNAPTN